MKSLLTDLRAQRSEKSFQVGMNKKDLIRDMGFELVLLDGECLGTRYVWEIGVNLFSGLIL